MEKGGGIKGEIAATPPRETQSLSSRCCECGGDEEVIRNQDDASSMQQQSPQCFRFGLHIFFRALYRIELLPLYPSPLLFCYIFCGSCPPFTNRVLNQPPSPYPSPIVNHLRLGLQHRRMKLCRQQHFRFMNFIPSDPAAAFVRLPASPPSI